MRTEIILPELGLPDGLLVTLSVWYAEPGDFVFEGDRLVEVLTDGATFDVPSPATGQLVERWAYPRDVLRPGQVLGVVWLALIHVEIEHEDTVQPLRPRMYQYYEQLRRQYRLPVLPIGLYLGVGLSGIGIDVYEEHFGPLRVLQFQYLCVGLPALDARKYAAGDNWLGVALSALMRCPPDERAQLTLESLQRLETCPENAWRRHLLGECVCAYSPLTDAQREEVADQFRAITKDPESPMTKSLLDTLQERGRQEGVRHSLRIVLEEKFGPLSPEVIERLSGMSQEEIEQTLRAFIRAKSLQELGLENGAGAQA